jgi:hypothetical protein
MSSQQKTKLVFDSSFPTAPSEAFSLGGRGFSPGAKRSKLTGFSLKKAFSIERL